MKLKLNPAMYFLKYKQNYNLKYITTKVHVGPIPHLRNSDCGVPLFHRGGPQQRSTFLFTRLLCLNHAILPSLAEVIRYKVLLEQWPCHKEGYADPPPEVAIFT